MTKSNFTGITLLWIVIASVLAPTNLYSQSKTSALQERLNQLKKTRKSKEAIRESAEHVNPTYKKMLPGIALIQCADNDGVVSGTGWLLDAEQKLFVTNQHVIEGFADCFLYFPEFENGKLVTDPDTSIRDSRAHSAKVIDSAVGFDLAIVQLKGDLPPGIQVLEIADESAAPGTSIHSVAGSTVGSQSLWVYSTGHVRQTVVGLMANDYEATLLESDMATNQGNSGGPVCNDQGQVVAVVEGHRTDARLVSIYVSRESLIEYLAIAIRCVNPQTSADAAFASRRHLEAGRAESALDILTQAVKENPKSAELIGLRGRCWYCMDDEESARADFVETLELDPTHSPAYFGLGLLASDNGEYEKALKLFTNGIRKNPDDIDCRVARGRTRALLNDWNAAYREFNNTLRRHPDSLEARQGRAFASIEIGKYDEGLADLEAIVERCANNPVIFYYYGEALVGKESPDEAIQFYTAAINLAPEYMEAQLGLGISHVLLGQYQESVDPLAIVLNDNAEHARANYFYGLSQVRLGNDQGIEWIRYATELEPDHTGYAEGFQIITDELETLEAEPSEPESTTTKPTDQTQ